MAELASVNVSALGVPLRVDVIGDDADALAAEIRRVWHLCLEVPRGASGTILVDRRPGADRATPDPDYQTVVSEVSEAFALQRLTQAVTRLGIEGRAGELFMVHAAGLAHPVTGDAVALVAPGGTGKTTACRTLGPGWSYLTDETFAIDRNDRVIAYPKPLSVRVPDVHAKAETAPGDVGLRPCPVPATLKALLVLERLGGTIEPTVTPLNSLDAIVAIAPETSSLSKLPSPLHYLRDLLGRMRMVAKVTYGEAESLRPLITELIGEVTR